MLVNDLLNETTGIEAIEEVVDTMTGTGIDDDEGPTPGLGPDQETDTPVDILGEIEADLDPDLEIDDEIDIKK
jgi:hypothetical protein